MAGSYRPNGFIMAARRLAWPTVSLPVMNCIPPQQSRQQQVAGSYRPNGFIMAARRLAWPTVSLPVMNCISQTTLMTYGYCLCGEYCRRVAHLETTHTHTHTHSAENKRVWGALNDSEGPMTPEWFSIKMC